MGNSAQEIGTSKLAARIEVKPDGKLFCSIVTCQGAAKGEAWIQDAPFFHDGLQKQLEARATGLFCNGPCHWYHVIMVVYDSHSVERILQSFSSWRQGMCSY